MSLELDGREYTSPSVKLIQFFWNSRNQWKRKCQEAKKQNKLLSNQTRAVEHSRDHWKQLANERAERIAEMEEQLKKKRAAAC